MIKFVILFCISLLLGCSNDGSSAKLIRSYFIKFNYSQSDRVLQMLENFASVSKLTETPIPSDAFFRDTGKAGNVQNYTVFQVYSKSTNSDKYIVLSFDNSKLYCGLDLLLYVTDNEKNNEIVHDFDALITKLREYTNVELYDPIPTIEETSELRKTVRFGYANNDVHCT